MIELRYVSHRYERASAGAGPTLRGITLTIDTGSFVSVLGPSGCGKTTLLRIIAGFVKPSTGQVRFDGKTITGPSRDRFMMFQEFSLLPWRAAGSNVAFPAEIAGTERHARSGIVTAALGWVGMSKFATFFPDQLSAGMKQRVELARALSAKPSHLLLDEPFAKLDAYNRECLQIELAKLWESDRKTVVLVTHDIDEAIFLSNRIIVLSAPPGEIVADILIDLPESRWKDFGAIRGSRPFLDYRRQIWDLLMSR